MAEPQQTDLNGSGTPAPAEPSPVSVSPEPSPAPASDPAPEPTPSEPVADPGPITLDEVDAAFATKDPEKIEEARKRIYEGNLTPSGDPVPTADPASPDPTGDAKKLFEVHYQNTKHEVADENGLLGYKTTGHLKSAYVKANLRAEALERQALEARSYGQQQAAAAKEWENKYRSAQQTAPVAPPSAPGTPPAPAAAPPAAPAAPVAPALPSEPPLTPTYPVLSSSDPTDYSEDDIAKIAEYNTQMAEYSTKRQEFDASTSAYLQYLATNPPVSSTASPELQQELAALRAHKEKSEGVLSKIEQDEAARVAREEKKSHWERFNSFQNKHKDLFGTTKHIEEVHNDVSKWMDKLAVEGYGLTKPIDETGEEYATWSKARLKIVGAYLNENPDALQKAEGIEPPDGYKTYFQLADLNRQHRSLVEQKTLGQNSSLEDAYLFGMKSSGALDEQLNDLRTNERIAAAEATAAALEAAGQHATPIPNDETQRDMVPVDLSVEDYKWFMDIDQFSYRALSAAEKEKYDKIAQSAGVSMG